MKLKATYLLLAIIGAAVPLVFFAFFIADQGLSLIAFTSALFVNGAAGGFTADLLISSFVFWIYMFANQKQGPKPWLFIIMNLCIGLSLALPAYFWAKTRDTNEHSEAL
ncbi:MAG: hypothetical protein DHS20C12_16590 [Pseudohongiella sp.]|nr:MAG: hypothetical protein DHS20C12_16590 [Pseudohongiella sp.]